MSRSYRKPFMTDGYGSPCKQWYKRHHNKKLRCKLRDMDYEIANGCAHKNCSGVDRWDIMDFALYVQRPVEEGNRLSDKNDEYRKISIK